MGLFLTVAVLLIGIFICIVNVNYQKIAAKNYSEWRKISVFNTAKAWGIYAICMSIILGGIFVVSITNVVTGFSNIVKQKDTVTQQQETSTQDDTSTQDTTTGTSTGTSTAK